MIEDKNTTFSRICNIHAVTNRNMLPYASKEGWIVTRATKLPSGNISYWLQKKATCRSKTLPQ